MRFSVTATETFHSKLKKAADAAGMGISEYVRYAINRLWEGK